MDTIPPITDGVSAHFIVSAVDLCELPFDTFATRYLEPAHAYLQNEVRENKERFVDSDGNVRLVLEVGK